LWGLLFNFFPMIVTGFEGIYCEINEDFWFEEDKIITSDGWTFTMTKAGDYTLYGIVLGTKTYNKYDTPYVPINTFSPIDLYMGVDDLLENPQSYPYTITKFDNRVGYTMFNGLSESYAEYFRTHSGNNHIIPHNQEVLNELRNIDAGDVVLIKGSLVDLYGTKDNQYYRWDTDTQIGNYDCEIILVDELTIYSD